MNEDIPMKERYLELQTALVADVLDSLGYRNQCLPWEIQSLKYGDKLFGPAFTIFGRDTLDERENDNATRVEMLGQITGGCIAVMSAKDSRGAAHWGEITALAARNAGCAGAVVDGGSRDVGKLIECAFPVFARFRSPAASTGRWSVVRWQIPVLVDGVAVSPGDFMFGDEDGVVAIPRDLAGRVLELAEEKFRKESGMREALHKGEAIAEVFKKFGHF